MGLFFGLALNGLGKRGRLRSRGLPGACKWGGGEMLRVETGLRDHGLEGGISALVRVRSFPREAAVVVEGRWYVAADGEAVDERVESMQRIWIACL